MEKDKKLAPAKMFKEIGFEYYNDDEDIVYKLKYSKTKEEEIMFDYDNKTCVCNIPIDRKLLDAINRQMEVMRY